MADYGELAEAAAGVEPAIDTAPKDRADYRLIGQSPPRLDVPAKIDGSAEYGIDVSLPGMLYGTVVYSPVIGAQITSFDATAARAMAGVEAIFHSAIAQWAYSRVIPGQRCRQPPS